VVVAATDPAPVPSRESDLAATQKNVPKSYPSILLAALALPGLVPAQAHAEEPPEESLVAFKYLHYQDEQEGLKRIKVDAPSLRLFTPLGTHWSIDASTVMDSVSGASPRYYSSISSASEMSDKRTAEDATVTYYRPRSSYSVGYAHSAEDDYVSDSASLSAQFSSDDHNTTLNVGLGGSSDVINPSNEIVEGEHKKTWQAILGVTQALTPKDIAQVQIGYSSGHGYFSDPYKYNDNRPRKHNEHTAVARWNHHFESVGGSLRGYYRYYDDSWTVHAHTVELDWAQPLNDEVMLTPTLRYYTQNAASFYIDPQFINGVPQPPPIPEGVYSSVDQRLAAFGEISAALRLDWAFRPKWSTNLRAEYSRQRSDWRPGGGSPGIAAFNEMWFEFGIERRF